MYISNISPWQGQQQSFVFPAQSGMTQLQPMQSVQSYVPIQAQGYNLPLQQSSISWGSMIPQGTFNYGFNPGQSWQGSSFISPMAGSHFISPQVSSYIPAQVTGMGNLTSGIRSGAGFAQPRVELAESNSDVIVTAELPNVDPNQIYLTVTDDSLSISALANLGGTSSSIHRTVALPTNVKSEHLDVNFSNGTLECRLPKSDLAVRRRVKVNVTG